MKKRKITIWIVSLALAVCVALAILLPTVILPAIRYGKATQLYRSGQYDEAIVAFEALNGYRDSAEQARAAYESYEIAKISEAKVGDSVTFGAYEQDNDASNGKEDIEWLVLDKDGDSVLVISRYALDCQPYNTINIDMVWEDCSLRAWLNDVFLSNAFSVSEQDRIRISPVAAERNPSYTTTFTGNDTEDRVFLLSFSEIDRYLDSESARQCQATAYANAQSAFSNISTANGNCLWWLRSQGIRRAYAAFVDSSGQASKHGYSVDHMNTAVRPALRIDVGNR